MSKLDVLRPLARANAVVTALVLAGATLLPILISRSVSAALLTNRSIDMSATQTSDGSGRASGTGVTYTVRFDVASAYTLQGIVIQFCTDSPVIGESCTDASTDGFSLDTPTVSANSLSGATDIDPSGWTVGGDNTDYIILSNGTGLSAASGDTVAFDIDGITNPSSEGTFYARITTYTVAANATGYTTATNPGSYQDEGGIALSVANELTVTARVQEVLAFCVGTDSASTIGPAGSDDCSDVAGTDLNLGVVVTDSIATTTTNSTGISNDGLMMIRTNALNGASIYYKAELDSSSGQLKQAGQACSGSSVADPCFNSVSSGAGTRAAIVTGTEAFGVALKNRATTSGGATDALRCDSDYYGDGLITCVGNVSGNNYAWLDDGSFDTLASSNGPIDDELVKMEFAATASPTTPTGLYNVIANFVATATF